MEPSTTILSGPTESAVPNTLAWAPGKYVELPITTPPFDASAIAIVCPPNRIGVGVI